MRYSLSFLVGLAALGLALPAGAQDGNIAQAVFLTVETTDVPDFEEAAIEHVEWHADQGDTWTWPAYQAVTGGQVEYVYVTVGHEWADFDNPSVDAAADQAHWARSVARYTATEEGFFWELLPEFSNSPPDPGAFPLVQVIEFEVNSGGDEAALYGFQKFKEATDMAPGAGPPYQVTSVVSGDGPPGYFVALWAPNFAAFGAEGPTPPEILILAFGEVEGRQIADDFAAATTITSSRIWTLRPDLSYFPN